MPSVGDFRAPRYPIHGAVGTARGRSAARCSLCIGAVMPGVSVKTDSIETAEMLIDAGIGVKAPYFHRSWVNLSWDTSEDELRHRLSASYELVRSSLPKKVQAQLDRFK
jgi:predicted DNA-binding protein (MmcQ/YjbR family)